MSPKEVAECVANVRATLDAMYKTRAGAAVRGLDAVIEMYKNAIAGAAYNISNLERETRIRPVDIVSPQLPQIPHGEPLGDWDPDAWAWALEEANRTGRTQLANLDRVWQQFLKDYRSGPSMDWIDVVLAFVGVSQVGELGRLGRSLERIASTAEQVRTILGAVQMAIESREATAAGSLEQAAQELIDGMRRWADRELNSALAAIATLLDRGDRAAVWKAVEAVLLLNRQLMRLWGVRRRLAVDIDKLLDCIDLVDKYTWTPRAVVVDEAGKTRQIVRRPTPRKRKPW